MKVSDHARPALDFSLLRDFRRRDGLNLEEVSRRSGVSVPVISRIERNQTAPELETVYRLAKAFAMSASDLLSLAESRTATRSTSTAYTHDAFAFEKVGFSNCSVYRARAAAGSKLSRPDVHGNEFEVCWVREGKLRILLPHETHELAAGDAIQFDAMLEHTYEVIESATVEIVHLRKPKQF